MPKTIPVALLDVLGQGVARLDQPAANHPLEVQIAGLKLAGADLRGGEVSGLDLAKLGSLDGLKVTADQQYALLSAMGVDVHAG